MQHRAPSSRSKQGVWCVPLVTGRGPTPYLLTDWLFSFVDNTRPPSHTHRLTRSHQILGPYFSKESNSIKSKGLSLLWSLKKPICSVYFSMCRLSQGHGGGYRHPPHTQHSVQRGRTLLTLSAKLLDEHEHRRQCVHARVYSTGSSCSCFGHSTVGTASVQAFDFMYYITHK